MTDDDLVSDDLRRALDDPRLRYRLTEAYRHRVHEETTAERYDRIRRELRQAEEAEMAALMRRIAERVERMEADDWTYLSRPWWVRLRDWWRRTDVR